ncbi:Arc family DNA-binding protein [Paraburkholderia phytofirmans]|uniref:Arc family DNA-binding protein n=1 Tax=Paraburkholderia sp. BL9I2N2 TaxID=1938809 RepID=UPI0010532926|nr:Arc family DNA-binding protein [Paraburkholderia sp. BL9I2N2]TCK96017.1 Arc-like DNA binding dprotein [Paraburkholderia sp. BL9I2N2]
MSTAAQLPQMKLRLPETLKDWLTAQAEVNRRSVNAEVVFRLQNSLLAGAVLSAEKENAPLAATGEAL